MYICFSDSDICKVICPEQLDDLLLHLTHTFFSLRDVTTLERVLHCAPGDLSSYITILQYPDKINSSISHKVLFRSEFEWFPKISVRQDVEILAKMVSNMFSMKKIYDSHVEINL